MRILEITPPGSILPLLLLPYRSHSTETILWEERWSDEKDADPGAAEHERQPSACWPRPAAHSPAPREPGPGAPREGEPPRKRTKAGAHAHNQRQLWSLQAQGIPLAPQRHHVPLPLGRAGDNPHRFVPFCTNPFLTDPPMTF